MRILVRLVLNRKLLEIISRCRATLSAIGCTIIGLFCKQVRWNDLRNSGRGLDNPHEMRGVWQISSRSVVLFSWVSTPAPHVSTSREL